MYVQFHHHSHFRYRHLPKGHQHPNSRRNWIHWKSITVNLFACLRLVKLNAIAAEQSPSLCQIEGNVLKLHQGAQMIVETNGICIHRSNPDSTAGGNGNDDVSGSNNSSSTTHHPTQMHTRWDTARLLRSLHAFALTVYAIPLKDNGLPRNRGKKSTLTFVVLMSLLRVFYGGMCEYNPPRNMDVWQSKTKVARRTDIERRHGSSGSG